MLKKQDFYTGQQFRDLEGRLFQVITEARHTGNGELMVVYQELSGQYAVLTESKSSFLERMLACEPDGNQKGKESPDREEKAFGEEAGPKGLMEFLDAPSCREKLNILMGMEKDLDGNTLNSITVSLDLPITDHDFSERLDLVKDYLQTRIRFENNRLR